MKFLYRPLGLLFVSVFFFQCQKDLSYIGSGDPLPVLIAPAPITANLQGNIFDENDQPAAGVTITVGTQTALTDATGYFRITDASLDKNTSLVVAQKVGYFKGFRVFAATSGTNQVIIKLIKKTLAGTITASLGGTAYLSNGAQISLPADGVVIAGSGSSYSGDVKVYAAYIDPKAVDIAETVPGSFTANDKNGKRVTLSSFGMLAVELESAAGEKLQIKTGAVAKLTTPIPASNLASAPATISLWYVDEKTGLWKEEGTATKQGNSYVGDVKHFSFWNCDYPFDAVSLSVTVHNAANLPLTYVNVRIVTADSGSSGYGITDSLGVVKGMVPINKNLVLEVLDPCYGVVYSQNIPPLSENTDLGVITAPNSVVSLLTLKGTLIDCSGLPVADGYAIINFKHYVYFAHTDSTGQYAVAFSICSAGAGLSGTASFTGVDQASQQQSSVTNVPLTLPVTDAGSIIACGTSNVQFINYTLDDTDYAITSSAQDSITGFTSGTPSGNTTYFSGSPGSNFNNSISFSLSGVSAAGTFPLSDFSVRQFNSVILTQPFNITFTKFANSIGEFYEGSISGQFTANAVSTVHKISVTFKVRRIS